MIIDSTKLLTLVLVVVATSWLTYTGHIEGQACVGILGGALGYVFGNGHGVAEARRYADRAERAASAAAGQAVTRG